MKRVLFLLVMLPALCFAQRFEIGVDGGFDFHSLPMANTIADQDKPRGNYALFASETLADARTKRDASTRVSCGLFLQLFCWY